MLFPFLVDVNFPIYLVKCIYITFCIDTFLWRVLIEELHCIMAQYEYISLYLMFNSYLYADCRHNFFNFFPNIFIFNMYDESSLKYFIIKSTLSHFMGAEILTFTGKNIAVVFKVHIKPWQMNFLISDLQLDFIQIGSLISELELHWYRIVIGQCIFVSWGTK